MTLSEAARGAAKTAAPTFAILLWPGTEMLDLAAPYEVFHYAGRAWTVGTGREIRLAPGSSRLIVDHTLETAPAPDVLIVPGGDHEASDARAAVEYIRSVAAATTLVASICTGAFLIGRAGLLQDRNCTTHSRYRDALRREFPFARVHEATLVADGASLITAANVASGIDLALYVLRRFFGDAAAERAAVAMNYPWRRADVLEFNGAQRIGRIFASDGTSEPRP